MLEESGGSMSRTPVTVRTAEPSDVASLRELWSDILRKGGLDEQLADIGRVVATARERDDQCVAVAEIDGEVAGAVYLEATTFTPLNLEPAVLAVSPHVLPQFRRKGVGSALMEVACRFAEQHGIAHVQTAAAAFFAGAGGDFGVDPGATGFGLGEGPPGGRGERLCGDFGRRLAGRRPAGLVGNRHGPHFIAQ